MITEARCLKCGNILDLSEDRRKSREEGYKQAIENFEKMIDETNIGYNVIERDKLRQKLKKQKEEVSNKSKKGWGRSYGY